MGIASGHLSARGGDHFGVDEISQSTGKVILRTAQEIQKLLADW